MATITELPDEVIEIILSDKNISIENIVSFKSTCKQFRKTIEELRNKFWEQKFYLRCPTAKIKYTIEKQKKILKNTDFEKQIKIGLKYVKDLKYYVHLMSENNLWVTDKEKLECLLRSVGENPKSLLYYFAIDELNTIVSAQPPDTPSCNVAILHNFYIIIRCIKQYRLMYKRKKFINMPEERQLLEQLLTIVGQYFDPQMSFSCIKTWLDNITQKVLFCLKEEYPEHPIFSTSLEQFSVWKNNNIYDNFWSETEARQIRRVLEKYIPFKLKRHEMVQLMTTLNLKTDDHKIKFSSVFEEYLQPIIYHSVARRLGIRCVLMPKDIFDDIDYQEEGISIIWKSKYNTENLNNAEYIVMVFNEYIEPNNGMSYDIIRGRYNFLSHEDLPSNVQIVDWMIHYYIYQTARIIEVFWWELNILKDIMINNKDINVTSPIKVKSDIVRRKPKTRNKEIKFAIGMIVRHICTDKPRLFSDWNLPYHIGVIIGWHFKCEVELVKESLRFIAPHLTESKYYEHQCIFLHECTNSNQPHYIFLTEGDIICYVQQDELMELCLRKRIRNVEIGQYFFKFERTHYIPNESLAIDYPDDISFVSNSQNIQHI